jgi:hypothetical protein
MHSFDTSGGDECVNVRLFNAYILSDFRVRDSSFVDEPADESKWGAEPVRHLLRCQQADVTVSGGIRRLGRTVLPMA